MAKDKEQGLFRDLQSLMTAAVVIGRSRMARMAGKTFGGQRDMYEALGYKEVLTASDYRGRYERGGMAARIVEVKPEDTWRGGFEVIEDQDVEKVTAFEQAFLDLDKRLDIQDVLFRADVVSGIGRYSVVLIGGPGELDLPLEQCSADDIRYLSVYAEEDATVSELETDAKNERFGLPKYYTVKRTSLTTGTSKSNSAVGKKVHHSRILHYPDNVLDDRIYGRPRLERVWNLLDDLDKVTGGGAEAFWKRADAGRHYDIDPTLNLSQAELDALDAQLQEYKHGLKREIRTSGVKITPMGSDVASFKDPSESVIQQICASIGVPMRVFLGSEQGKLAADQDSVKYYRSIEARREKQGARMVELLVDRLIELKALPTPKDYEVSWSQIKTMDEDEKATLANRLASLPPEVISDAEIREIALGLDPIEEAAPARVARGKEEPTWKSVHRAADRFPRKDAARAQGRLLEWKRRAGQREAARVAHDERRTGDHVAHGRSDNGVPVGCGARAAGRATRRGRNVRQGRGPAPEANAEGES